MSSATFVVSWAVIGGTIATLLSVGTRHLLFQESSSSLAARLISPVLTAILFATLAWHFGDHFDLMPYSCLVAVGVPLAAIDATEQRLPSALVFPGIAVIGGLFAESALVHSSGPSFLRAVGGMVILAGFYLVLALASGGGLGAGDVKLGGLLGLALGWLGWPALVTATFLGWCAAAVARLIMRVTGRRARDSLQPMGPFLLAAALVVVCTAPM